MVRIYGVALCKLRGQADTLLRELPQRIVHPWQARHPKIRNTDAYLASLAGVWLLWKSGADGTLAYTDNGKPYLTDPNRAISITHTQAYAFCAVSDASDAIGLDAEDLGRLDPDRVSSLAKRWFTEKEQAELGANDTEEVFLSIWTRKEALVKQTGEGLCAIRKTDADLASVCSYRIENTILSLAHFRTDTPSSEIEIL